MFNKLWSGLRLCVSALWRDTRGAVLIYVTVGLTVLLGGAALVIDAGRLYTMNSQLQAGADALALAGPSRRRLNVGVISVLVDQGPQVRTFRGRTREEGQTSFRPWLVARASCP